MKCTFTYLLVDEDKGNIRALSEFLEESNRLILRGLWEKK